MIPTLYEVFQHWSKSGSVYIISDTHFDDEDCPIMDSNWITPEEQIAILNKYAHKNDTLIHLGDVGELSYVRRLKAGHKVLIMGNHDESATKFKRQIITEIFDSERYTRGEVRDAMREKYPDWGIRISEDVSRVEPYHRWIATADNHLFDEVYEGPLVISEKILLSHEPIQGLPFFFNIHGHDHNARNKGNLSHMNLAANVCGYKPISLGEAIKSGILAKIDTIHRETIDRATKNPIKKRKPAEKKKEY